MERTTKKDKNGHFYTNQANCRNIWSSDGKKLEGEYFENKTLAIDGKAIDKLGELEDLEEEHSIGLITLLAALTNGFYVKYYGDFTYCKLNINENDLVVDFRHKRFTDNYANDYFFKDYGKTWALTKEELL